MKSPEAIVKGMLDNDAFSQLLGMQVKELGPGFCTLSCPVSAQTTNGFGIAHGGLTYSLACLLYTSPSPRDVEESRMPSSA